MYIYIFISGSSLNHFEKGQHRLEFNTGSPKAASFSRPSDLYSIPPYLLLTETFQRPNNGNPECRRSQSFHQLLSVKKKINHRNHIFLGTYSIQPTQSHRDKEGFTMLILQLFCLLNPLICSIYRKNISAPLSKDCTLPLRAINFPEKISQAVE